jgi:CRP-like cAMP-binding protein
VTSRSSPSHAVLGRLADAPLFRGFPQQQLDNLSAVCHQRVYQPGDFILREGETDQFVYILVEGRARLVKNTSDTGDSLSLRELAGGDVLGEMKLLDRKPSSASVVAVTVVRALAIDLDAFEVTPSLAETRTVLLHNLGDILADRLRHTNTLGVDAMRRELDENRARTHAGRFALLMFAMLAGYQLALSALTLVPDWRRPPDSVLSFAFILAGCIPVLLSLQSSPFPRESYGLTLHRGWRAAGEALILTVPLLVALVLIKLALMRWVPSMQHRPLFDTSALFAGRPFDPGFLALAMLMYAVHAPLQEFVVRVGMQGALQHFIPAPQGRPNWKAILISNVVFAANHTYIGFWFCLVAFLPGLFWGYLFARQRSWIGVSVSHVAVGLWALFALGLHAVIGGG